MYYNDKRDDVRAVILVATYRRPEMLQSTLRSLLQQDFTDLFDVVVIDNDHVNLDGAKTAATFMRHNSMNGCVIVEPTPGNCSALNAAITFALAAYPNCSIFLIIDDDEIAAPQWVRSIVHRQQSTGAHVVGGPVYPQFCNSKHAFLSNHPAFKPAYEVSGQVRMIYGSGNCLLTREAIEAAGNPIFDYRFNHLGGGDADLFNRLRIMGFDFHWCTDSVIYETVPASRTTFNWLSRRGLRIGAINYLLEKRERWGHMRRFISLSKTILITLLSPYNFLRLWIETRSLLIAYHPFFVALGRWGVMMNMEYHQYKPSID